MDLKDTGEECGEPMGIFYSGRTGELVDITNLGQDYHVLAYRAYNWG